MTELGELSAGITRHTYPTSAMVGDYLRAVAGLVPAGVLYATEPVGAVATAVIGGFAAIFAVFGLRTVLRHGTRLEASNTELRAHGVACRTIAWSQLDRMRLAYYSTRRDRKSGWMQLQLGAGGARVSLDSRIDGFEGLVRRAATAAAARGIPLNDTTLANIEALGITLPEPGAER
jgi:hypothetical protein